jgi:hypothetical protein
MNSKIDQVSNGALPKRSDCTTERSRASSEERAAAQVSTTAIRAGETMRIVAGFRERFGSGRSERTERRRQRKIRAATINNQVNRAAPHGDATDPGSVRGRGPDRYQGRD